MQHSAGLLRDATHTAAPSGNLLGFRGQYFWLRAWEGFRVWGLGPRV